VLRGCRARLQVRDSLSLERPGLEPTPLKAYGWVSRERSNAQIGLNWRYSNATLSRPDVSWVRILCGRGRRFCEKSCISDRLSRVSEDVKSSEEAFSAIVDSRGTSSTWALRVEPVQML
jgi:hypothetical protein